MEPIFILKMPLQMESIFILDYIILKERVNLLPGTVFSNCM